MRVPSGATDGPFRGESDIRIIHGQSGKGIIMIDNRPSNWAGAFQDMGSCEDILARVRTTERWFRGSVPVFLIIVAVGLFVMETAGSSDLKTMLIGLFLMLVGVINIAGIGVWAHGRCHTLYVIWDRQNRLEAELQRSRADDL